ncbi:NYN domain-containing protein [Jiangella alba]|uniref:YacP-like NYN domain-containing protein n=1 Tax=Jiangella alba TaxID=561176 RepID=A0A1H5KC81_9ACTN|nr:NYN domain-containing protein [Jiangella alba]SEE61681.1 YacP-like NYN domain-containing protein [Jiangella alba]
MSTLPDSVRSRLVALGSDVLGALPAGDVPGVLRPVAKFAAAKRARLGGSAIASALDTEPGFRRRVLDTASAADPALAKALESGTAPAAADPVDVAVLAYLLRPDGWEAMVESAAASVRHGDDAARLTREAAAAERLREQLDAARAATRELRTTMRAEIDRVKAENTMLRRRIQETRERLSEARQQERDEQQDAGRELSDARAALRAAETEVRRLRTRLSDAEAALEAARRSGRAERGLGTARLALLLDTLGDAAAGLRRELALPASTLAPADTVEAVIPGSPLDGGAVGRARAADEPGYLDELLSLPRVHLVVDGYNVTKAAWPTMPLDSQRSRLAQGLAAVSARTGAEVTLVFDGADVTVPPPVAGTGIRVRFSPVGQTADELIRRLVRAEPQGRPVIVVSSDREIADGVRRPGVRSVEAVALIGLLRQ